MRPGPYARHWAIAEERRQELLRDVDRIWQIRNAHANDPQPVAAPSRLSCIFDAVLTGLARASDGPVAIGPCPFRSDASTSIEKPGAGQPR